MTISIFSGGTSTAAQFVEQARAVFEGIDLRSLRVPFIARAGFDQDPLPCRANQKEFIAMRMRLRSSAGDFRSHMGFGITPNIAPPSRRNVPSVIS